MKKISSILLAIMLIVSNSTNAYAWDWRAAYEDDWTRGAKSTEKFTKVPTKATLKANCDIYTYTPVLLEHEVRSSGISDMTYDYKLPGYKYTLPKGAHTIEASVTGIGVDIDIENVNLTLDGKTAIANYNSARVSYKTQIFCYSLIQYKEKHTVVIDLYRPYITDEPEETIDVVSTIKLYK